MDDNFVLSPAALWSCLIVFLVDPPPENFEQLTSGKHLLDRWLAPWPGLSSHFSPFSAAAFLNPCFALTVQGRKLYVTVNQESFFYGVKREKSFLRNYLDSSRKLGITRSIRITNSLSLLKRSQWSK